MELNTDTTTIPEELSPSQENIPMLSSDVPLLLQESVEEHLSLEEQLMWLFRIFGNLPTLSSSMVEYYNNIVFSIQIMQYENLAKDILYNLRTLLNPEYKLGVSIGKNSDGTYNYLTGTYDTKLGLGHLYFWLTGTVIITKLIFLRRLYLL